MDNETKHTPGPWVLHQTFADEVVAKEGIVKIADCHEDLGISKIEREANAHLIAAAPDLLNALAALMCASVNTAEKHESESSNAIWAYIEDGAEAIAKAKGML